MGEIDTKPIEPVQVALSLFGEKGDQRKSQSTSRDGKCENEKEIEGLLTDLANNKVQLEAKDTSYKQALLNLEHYQKTTDELSRLLKNCEIERDMYIDECKEARTRIDELESKMKEMDDQLLETVYMREQLSHVLSELKATQGELLSMETELAVARDSKLKAMTQAELMETAANIEKEKTEELLNRVSELSEAYFKSKLAAIEAEREKSAILSEKDAEIELATAVAVQAQEQLEDMRKQIEVIPELENRLTEKSIFVDTLQLKLKQANELLGSSERSAFDAINDLNQLQVDLEVEERKNLDQSIYIEALEMELNELKLELRNSKEEVGSLNCGVEMLTGELQKLQTEMDEIQGRETEAQVEIALLKSELHKGKSKIAAAEAAEARATIVKSGLYLAVQQLAVEAQEAKEENQKLKQAADKVAEETESPAFFDSQSENSFQDIEASQTNELKTEDEENRHEDDAHITIPLKEYESLIRKAEKADHVHLPLREDSSQSTMPENKHELQSLKKELEFAMMKVGEFRTCSEQAVSRAEMAEKAKAALEGQLRRWREQKQRRKAALAALREEFVPKTFSPPTYDKPPKTYQPLGKVLNMKF